MPSGAGEARPISACPLRLAQTRKTPIWAFSMRPAVPLTCCAPRCRARPYSDGSNVSPSQAAGSALPFLAWCGRGHADTSSDRITRSGDEPFWQRGSQAHCLPSAVALLSATTAPGVLVAVSSASSPDRLHSPGYGRDDLRVRLRGGMAKSARGVAVGFGNRPTPVLCDGLDQGAMMPGAGQGRWSPAGC
jgi:hypothetical protein